MRCCGDGAVNSSQVMSRRERIGFLLWGLYTIGVGGALVVYGVSNLGARGLLLCGAAGVGMGGVATGVLLAWLAITCRKHEREERE